MWNTFSDFRPDAAVQIRSPISLFHRGIGFGLDVLHRLSSSAFISHTLLILFSSVLCSSLSHFLSFFLPSISLTRCLHISFSPPRVVSHFCCLQAWCEDNSPHKNFNISFYQERYDLFRKMYQMCFTMKFNSVTIWVSTAPHLSIAVVLYFLIPEMVTM